MSKLYDSYVPPVIKCFGNAGAEVTSKSIIISIMLPVIKVMVSQHTAYTMPNFKS